jgi:hypothetical protein
MLSLWSSPSVLTLGCPHRALSRVHFVRPCLPLAPLPLPYVGTRLPLSCCRRPHHSGRCPFSSPMAPALSSSAVGFSDGRALARANHHRLAVRLGRCYMRRLHRPPSTACGTCACCCSGSTVCSGPSPWEIYLVLSIPFFLSHHPQTVKSDGAIPFVRAGVMVHTDLRSCARPQLDSSPLGYLYVLLFSFSSPFPFPPHLPSVAPILSFVKLVFFSG